MTTITEFQKHWLSTRCIYDGEERQFVPEKVRKYITPHNYLPCGFTFLKSIIPYLKRGSPRVNWHSYDDLAFYLITTTPTTDDITNVFDKCNNYNIPLYRTNYEFKDICSFSMQCRKSTGYYGGYDSDEDYGHNSIARKYAAQIIFMLYNKDKLLEDEKCPTFNALRFIFTHDCVFNERYMHHCYHIASLKKHLFSKKQWLRLTKEFNGSGYDDGEQDLSTDPYEMTYCSDCSDYGHPSWGCPN
jgi:hypothetical protein